MKKRNTKLRALLLVCFSTAVLMSSVFTGCGDEDSKGTVKQTETVAKGSETGAGNKPAEKETKKAPETENGTTARETEKQTEEATEKAMSETAKPVPQEAESTATATEQTVSETTAAELVSSDEQTAQAGTTGEVDEESGDNTYRMELSDYAYEAGLLSMVEILELQQTESKQFYTYGIRYEGGGMYVEWQPVSETNPIMAPITIECAGNDSVSMYGIYCGQSYEDAKALLMQSGWHIAGNDLETPKGFYMELSEQEHYLMYLITDDAGDTVSEWSWLNWPQGELVIN